MYPRASRAPISLIAAMRAIGLVGVASALVACGGSDTVSTSTPTSTVYQVENYTIGGTISGLTVSSVVLANGTSTVGVAAAAGGTEENA